MLSNKIYNFISLTNSICLIFGVSLYKWNPDTLLFEPQTQPRTNKNSVRFNQAALINGLVFYLGQMIRFHLVHNYISLIFSITGLFFMLFLTESFGLTVWSAQEWFQMVNFTLVYCRHLHSKL